MFCLVCCSFWFLCFVMFVWVVFCRAVRFGWMWYVLSCVFAFGVGGRLLCFFGFAVFFVGFWFFVGFL